jgi:hypothetical protein
MVNTTGTVLLAFWAARADGQHAVISARPSLLDADVSAFDKTGFGQPFAEGIGVEPIGVG